MRCLRLPFTFDPEKLRADLALVRDDEWIPHVQRRHYEGLWSGAALRSLGGSRDNLVPEARDGQRFADTALLARCPYFRAVLAHFRCPLNAVRLLRLQAGSAIAEHVDHALDFEDGEVRIHIPIVTSDGVRFILDGSRLVLAPGECWYTNVNLPHAVENTGTVDRIHLVLDCVVDDWLHQLFASTPAPHFPNHTATVRGVTGSSLAVLPVFAAVAQELAAAGAPVTFRSEGATLILNWAGIYSWQIRLRLPASVDIASDWSAELESSPDLHGEHRGDFVAVMDAIRREFPRIEVHAAGAT
ncbi:MAG: aspartyl/asparaginyl beta-hydroxylase domain-containing protein [Candidatus Didemnitutus sp.]|nr:aspartyl/asparaginyl beta-hydroxylase domain-containing protein [Candidatus Didemnitutus sp.]